MRVRGELEAMLAIGAEAGSVLRERARAAVESRQLWLAPLRPPKSAPTITTTASASVGSQICRVPIRSSRVGDSIVAGSKDVKRGGRSEGRVGTGVLKASSTPEECGVAADGKTPADSNTVSACEGSGEQGVWLVLGSGGGEEGRRGGREEERRGGGESRAGGEEGRGGGSTSPRAGERGACAAATDCESLEVGSATGAILSVTFIFNVSRRSAPIAPRACGETVGSIRKVPPEGATLRSCEVGTGLDAELGSTLDEGAASKFEAKKAATSSWLAT